MNFGILGSGNVGATIGKGLLNKGHSVMFSFTHDEEKLRKLAQEYGPDAAHGTPRQAAAFGEMLLLDVPWEEVEGLIETLGDLTGKIILDCTNPVKPDLSGLALGDTSAAEQIAGWAPDAYIIKALNTVGVSNMANPRYGKDPVSAFVCGDHEISKSLVLRVLESLGFDAVDCGPLEHARWLESMGLLWTYLAQKQDLGPNIAFRLMKR